MLPDGDGVPVGAHGISHDRDPGTSIVHVRLQYRGRFAVGQSRLLLQPAYEVPDLPRFGDQVGPAPYVGVESLDPVHCDVYAVPPHRGVHVDVLYPVVLQQDVEDPQSEGVPVHRFAQVVHRPSDVVALRVGPAERLLRRKQYGLPVHLPSLLPVPVADLVYGPSDGLRHLPAVGVVPRGEVVLDLPVVGYPYGDVAEGHRIGFYDLQVLLPADRPAVGVHGLGHAGSQQCGGYGIEDVGTYRPDRHRPLLLLRLP